MVDMAIDMIEWALALLTQLGLTSHPAMEALPIHAFIASGCMA
jgi:hypothetical protein